MTKGTPRRGSGCSRGHSLDGVPLLWHRGHSWVSGSSRGAGAARGVTAWYRVPVNTQCQHRGDPNAGAALLSPKHCLLLAPTCVLSPKCHHIRGAPRALVWGGGGLRPGGGGVRLGGCSKGGRSWGDPMGSCPTSTGFGPGLSAAVFHWATCPVPWSHSPQHPAPFGAAVLREERVPTVPSIPTPGESHLLVSSSDLSRGSDADLPLLTGGTPRATWPRARGLGSLWRAQSHCHQTDTSLPPHAFPSPPQPSCPSS